ncbi:MAG: acyl-CoA dehydrogenase family protein [Burkholderiales bacterium]|nr:acyl-CoA dehydrogenase family protein [Burkholderiales bacterium]
MPIILEMGTYCRLDCALGTAGLMRAALTQALHHCSHRIAFGRRLVEQPLMRNVLADLALESEAATALAMRLARAFDAQKDEAEALLRRVLTPAAKYWICKRGPAFAAEAMEAIGGVAYVEESVLPRLYRQMPLNSIWEGSGNIMCLDILRAFRKHPKTLDALAAAIERGAAREPRLSRFAGRLKDELRRPEELEVRARAIAQAIALAVQAAILVEHAPGFVAEAFCASRLSERAFAGGAFGELSAATDFGAILARAWPAIAG